MMKPLKSVSIKYRLMGWFALCVLLTTVVGGWVVYRQVSALVDKEVQRRLATAADGVLSAVKTSTELSIKNRLRAVAEKNVEILAGLEKRVRAGDLSLAEAKRLGADILLTQRVGETGYLYCLSSRGTVEVHPNKALLGLNLAHEVPVSEQIQIRNGYLEYDWANPGEERVRPKALYMAYFEPWDWIVSASSYREEFLSLVDIEDFKDSIESYAWDGSGYIFVVTLAGDVILHPWFSGSMVEYEDAHGLLLFEKLTEQPAGTLHYSMKDPKTGSVRDKVTVYRTIPEFGWIVGVSNYLDEVNESVDTLGYSLLFVGAWILLAILPLSYFLGAAIVAPMRRQTASMAAADAGDLSVRADTDAPGELGELAAHFNSYMMRIQDYRDELRTEILDRTRMEEQLKLFAMVYENAMEGISITDPNGNIIAVNPAFTTITGYTPDEVVGKNPRVLKSERHEPGFYKEMWAALKDHGSWHGEIWNQRKNGESFPEILSISAIRDGDGDITHFIAVFHDISDLKLKDEQIEHQAYHDGLTGLPNRVLMQERLSVAIGYAEREEERIGIYSLDLDDFKKINDSQGHDMGDALLREVAARLKRGLSASETLGRLGGDEFLLMVEGVGDDRHVVQWADRLVAAFREPFVIAGQRLHVSPSVGVTLFPDDGADASTLIKNADMAMYQSKAKGKNGYFLFTHEINERISRQLALENDMRSALRDQEFSVYFQPKVNAVTDTVVGMEALIRWQKPDGAVVGPGEFIPLAEETGLIVPMGEFVIEASCKAMQFLDGMGFKALKVSVNLSPVQFGQEDLVESILTNLERNGVPADLLEVEITESTLMENMEESVAKLDRLVEAGVSVAIDDFGTGHSSLYYLKRLPIHVLKIDQSFVRDVTVDVSDARIVETIIAMARKLDLEVVAEGVETEEQLAMLTGFGCEVIQGYYYSKPLSFELVFDFLRSRS